MLNDDELRKVPIHRSLIRSNLFAGAEREWILLVGLISFSLIFVGMSWPSFFVGLGLWVFGLPALRAMAKSDTNMTKVYIRHTKYSKFYAARSSAFRNQ